MENRAVENGIGAGNSKTGPEVIRGIRNSSPDAAGAALESPETFRSVEISERHVPQADRDAFLWTDEVPG